MLFSLLGDGQIAFEPISQFFTHPQAPEKLRAQTITVRRAAEIADVTYAEMLSLVSEKGIDVGYTTDNLERDLECI